MNSWVLIENYLFTKNFLIKINKEFVGTAWKNMENEINANVSKLKCFIFIIVLKYPNTNSLTRLFSKLWNKMKNETSID